MDTAPAFASVSEAIGMARAALGYLAAADYRREREADRVRAIARVVAEVAGYPGNTRLSPGFLHRPSRVIDQYEHGHTIASALGELGQGCEFGDLATRDHAEKAVVKLLVR